MRSICVRMGILGLILSLILPAGAVGASFRDVDVSYWAYPYIQSMADQGIVSGVGDGLFQPEDGVSTAEFCVMLTNAFYGGYHSGSTQDGAWWEGYLDKMEQSGILQGTQVQQERKNGEWDPDLVTAPMTRYDMAQMMYQTLIAQGIWVENVQRLKQAKESIRDYDQIPTNYQQAVVTLYAIGCLSGANEEGDFCGDQIMTRAQACVALYRLQGKVDDLNLQAQNVISGKEQWEKQVFQLVNQVREDNGLPPLEYNERLAAVARAHSEDMRDRSFFAHVNPDGLTTEDRIEGAGIPCSECGEVIASGYPSPQSVVEGWINTQSYRETILGQYDAAGVGFAVGFGDGYYWTMCLVSY